MHHFQLALQILRGLFRNYVLTELHAQGITGCLSAVDLQVSFVRHFYSMVQIEALGILVVSALTTATAQQQLSRTFRTWDTLPLCVIKVGAERM